MESVYLRLAEQNDIDTLYKWANDIEVRKNSFNSNLIKYGEHKQWFESIIQSINTDIYICCLNNVPIGQVRLNYLDNNVAVISYSVDDQYRGKGFGNEILELIEQELIRKFTDNVTLIGKVKPDNIISQKVFVRNGYKQDVSNHEYIQYSKKLNA